MDLYFIIFGTILISSGSILANDEKKKSNLKRQIKKNESFKQYNQLKFKSLNKLKGMANDGLKQYTNTINNELHCGYVFKAFEHISILKFALQIDLNCDNKTTYQKIVNYSSLFKEYWKIIMFDVIDIPSISNILWIFFMYLFEFEEYILNPTPEDTHKIDKIHYTINSLLSKRLNSKTCSDYYQKQSNELEVLLSSINNENENRNFLYQFLINEINQNLDNHKQSSNLTMEMIRLNNFLEEHDIIKRVLSEFLIGFNSSDIDILLDTFSVPHSSEKDIPFSQRVMSIAELQNDFYGIVKTVILRNTLMYLRLANQINFSNHNHGSINELLISLNGKMLKYINKFSDFFYLKEDMNEIINRFKKSLVLFKVANAQKNAFEPIIISLNKIMKNLFDGKLLVNFTLNSKYIDNLLNDVEYYTMVSKLTYPYELQKMKEIVTDTKNYFIFLEDKFRNIDMKIIKSYAQIKFSKEIIILKLYEM